MNFFRDFPFLEFILIAGGICCVVPGIFIGWDGLVLAQGQASTTGEHVSTRLKNSGTAKSGRFGQSSHTVNATVDVVGFETTEGKWVTFETTVPSEYENGKMPLIYSPESPKTACIEPCTSLQTGGLLFGAGAFAIMLGYGLRVRRKNEEAEEE